MLMLVPLQSQNQYREFIDDSQYKKFVDPAIIRTMNTIIRQLGQRIQEARRAKGWTQEDLAHHAGLDFSYLNQLENGKRNPSIGTISKIATALGLPLKDLIPD